MFDEALSNKGRPDVTLIKFKFNRFELNLYRWDGDCCKCCRVFFFFFNHPTSDEIEILDAMIDHNGLNLLCELV